MFYKRQQKNDRGFTLIEIIVSMGIFIVILTVSMGSIISIFDANRKSKSLKTVLNNLNLVVDSMSREMRYGSKYHCGPGVVFLKRDCAGGDDLMSFKSSEGGQITYQFSDGAIEKSTIAGGGFAFNFVRLTAPEIIIDKMVFYTVGAEVVGDGVQPKVLIKIQGHSGEEGKGRSDFTIQTLVSQRSLDI